MESNPSGDIMGDIVKAAVTAAMLVCALPAAAEQGYFAREKLPIGAGAAGQASKAPKDMTTPEQVDWFTKTMTTAIAAQKAGGGDPASADPSFRQMSWSRGVQSVRYWHDNTNGDWVYGPYVAVYLLDDRVDEICGLFSKYRKRCTNYGPDGWYVVFDV